EVPTETESSTEEETVPAVDTSKLKVDKTVTAPVATGNAKADEDSGEKKVQDNSVSSSNAPVVTVTKTEIEKAPEVPKIAESEKSPSLNLPAVSSNYVFVSKQGLSGFKTIDGNLFYFDGHGNPVKGHQLLNGIRYYFNSYGAKASKTGIDVSKYQYDINWQKVKAAGVDYAIIRLGFRGYGSEGKMKIDNYFEKNLSGAKAAGVDVGVYFFSQATTVDEAVAEASLVVNTLKGRSLQYPVYFDTEYSSSPSRTGRADKISKQTRTQCAIAFCETVKKAGYRAGVYASKSFFNDELIFSSISKYEIWVAHYTKSVTSFQPYRMWQYTDKGIIDGISTKVDVNISLYDYKNRTDMSNIGNNVVFVSDSADTEKYNTAEKAVAAFENNPTQENYNTAKQLTDLIDNETLKSAFLKRLEAVEITTAAAAVPAPDGQSVQEQGNGADEAAPGT
ncbi:MAG TPA: hypothetical protein DCR23_03920, partial [Ruminococcaceae bacterium]|nr:hypothetical protein [Oscillospiraceae bacterium]